MADGPVSPDPPNESSKTWLMIGVMVAVLVLVAWPIKKYFFDGPPKPSTPDIVDIDPICQYMQKIELNCVVTPVAEGVLGPGHFVAYSTVAVPHTKVPFPNGDLFADSCKVPGAKATEMLARMRADLNDQEQKNNLTFYEITYRLDRTFQAGADLPVPKLADLKLKAGPKMTEVQEISLNVPHGWLKTIDENQFINLLAGAAIDQRCIDRVIKKEYSVISKAAIARDYDIVVKEKAGQSFGLSAAVTKGEITMSAGGDANSGVDETIKKNSALPVVVGVGFFDSEIFQQNREQLVSAIFSTTATTNVQARASDPRGVIWQTQRTGVLGESLPIHQSGGGLSNICAGGAPSTAALNTVLAPAAARPADSRSTRSFEFLTSGTIAGGLNPFRCQSVPAHIDAQVSFESVVETIVRSDEASILWIEFTGMPIGSAEVRDWTGRSLPQRPHDGGDKDNDISFQLAGVGVYQVRVSGQRHLTATGPGTVPVNERGAFTVSVR